MSKDYGEPINYDPHFNGPIHNRSCTDIIWLILFIIFLGGWGFLGFYSMKTGNIQKLLAPIDSRGQRCGLDSGLENKKYLVFFDIIKCLSVDTAIVGCPTQQVCVEQCPTRTIQFDKILTSSNFEEYKHEMVCTQDVNIQTLTLAQAHSHIENKKCASYVLQSKPVLGRCIGNLVDALKELANSTPIAVDQVSNLVNFNQLSSQIVQDLVQSRWYMLGALGAVVVLCFVYILLLRWVVAPVVWVSIAGLFGVLGFALYLCYKNYEYYRANPVTLHQTNNVKGFAQSLLTRADTWLVLLIILAVIIVILLLIVIFLRSRIVIAIALIREGSKAVSAIKSTIVFPIFPWIIQCGVIAYAVFVLMYLLSIGESAFKIVNLANDNNCDCGDVYKEDYVDCNPQIFYAKCFQKNTLLPCSNASCHFIGLDGTNYTIYLHLVNALGFFWAMFFISGVADMMLASTFSTWYWTFHKRNIPFFTLSSGIIRTVRYHLGTVAFGALIIAIVRLIRVILEYIDHKLKKFDNPFTRCVLCCCKCFFWCLENFLKFINKNAYIMCAVHGKGFCISARDAFSLLMRNIVRVVVLDKVMDFIFFLSKLLISIGVGFAVYYILEWNYVYEVTNGARLHYNYVPAVILSIATYLIATIFFNVYAMAVDTLFLCFLEDCERNDGSTEKPYYMSTNLLKILGKKNKRE